MSFDPDTLPVPDLGLSCPGCGYPLASLLEHRCPECGEGFTLEQFVPPGDMPQLIAGGRAVRAMPEILALLSRYQIVHITLSGPMEAMLGSYLGPVVRDHAPPIGVARTRYLEAIDLVRRLRQDEPMPHPPPTRRHGVDWACPACGEENPSNFELCWSCGEIKADPG